MPKKLPTSVDPNNTAWAKDKSRFGFLMLQKMGWKEGAGLGKEQQGSTEHVKVKMLEERVGLGGEVDQHVSWTIHKDNYDRILSKLKEKSNGIPDSGSDSDSPATPSSLIRAREEDPAESARKRQKKIAKKMLKAELLNNYSSSGLSAEEVAKKAAADKAARKEARAAKRSTRKEDAARGQ